MVSRKVGRGGSVTCGKQKVEGSVTCGKQKGRRGGSVTCGKQKGRKGRGK